MNRVCRVEEISQQDSVQGTAKLKAGSAGQRTGVTAGRMEDGVTVGRVEDRVTSGRTEDRVHCWQGEREGSLLAG